MRAKGHELKRRINTAHKQQQDSPQYLLKSHSHWRNQEIPMLTVLSGSWSNAQKIWNQWINDNGKITAIWSPEIAKPLSIIWLETLLKHSNLQTLLLSFLAKIFQCSIEQIHSKLKNKSKYELAIVQQQLPVNISSHGLSLLNWFLDKISMSQEITCRLAPELATVVKLENNQNMAQGISILAELLPVDVLPGLLVQVNDGELSNSPLLRTMLHITENIPAIPIALSINSKVLINYFASTPESRNKTMLHNGLIEVDPEQNLHFALPHETEQILRQYYAPIKLIEEAKSLHSLIADNRAEKSIARSRAELFLFQILELVPETKGVFQLNAKMSFSFGNQPMEIDLFAFAEHVAIEIDGYYHFQEPEDWRRDRRKDFALQMHGILVLRFLAEDVVSRLAEILDVVRQAIKCHGHKLN